MCLLGCGVVCTPWSSLRCQSAPVRSSWEINSTFTVFRQGTVFNSVDGVKGTCPEWCGSPGAGPPCGLGQEALTKPQFWFHCGEGLQERGPVAFTEAFKYTLQKMKTVMVLLLQNEHVSKILFHSSINERTSKMAWQVQIRGAQFI